jgi:serine/threonine-protein kinase RsbW
VTTLGLISVIRVPADLRSLALVRATLGTSLEREGWTGDPAGRVILAASEAVANAIEHGSTGGGQVQVELALGRDAAVVRVEDGGRPGARCPERPTSAPPMSSDRGRGLIIMRSLSDRVEVRAVGECGTEITLEFARAA